MDGGPDIREVSAPFERILSRNDPHEQVFDYSSVEANTDCVCGYRLVKTQAAPRKYDA